VLGALVGIDSRDPATPAARRFFGDYTRFLDRNALGAPHRRVEDERLRTSEKADAIVEEAIRGMRDAGPPSSTPPTSPPDQLGGDTELRPRFDFKHT